MSTQSFFAGFFIAAILCGGVVIFAFPEILETESSEEQKGNILQRKMIKTNSEAYIENLDIANWIDVPDTKTVITTKGNSFLVLGFSTPYTLQLGSSFSGVTRFNISLEVKGVGNHQGRIGYYRATTLGSYTEMHGTFYLNFETEVLPEGNYSIGVLWISVNENISANSYVFFSYSANFNFTRTLSIWEIQA